MRRDSGHAAVEFALAIGVLLLPVALVAVSFGSWLEGRVTAEATASEGSRRAALQLNVAEGTATAIDVLGASGIAPEHARLGWCGAAPGVGGAGACSFTRGSVVELVVQVWVPLFETPWGPVGGLWVEGHHAEPTDLYRSLG